MSVTGSPSEAELAGWTAANRRAGAETGKDQGGTRAVPPPPPETVPRPLYMEQVRANARLARELREARAELAKARRVIAVAKMRRKPPR